MGVTLEFVRATRSSLPDELSSGRIDILMAGLTGTVSRAQRMELSHPYNAGSAWDFWCGTIGAAALPRWPGERDW